jgi:hypothetical protein
MLLANDLAEDDPRLAEALSPEAVADLVVAGMEAERFLILTPDAGLEPLARRVEDWDAWLASVDPGQPTNDNRDHTIGVAGQRNPDLGGVKS